MTLLDRAALAVAMLIGMFLAYRWGVRDERERWIRHFAKEVLRSEIARKLADQCVRKLSGQ